MNKFTIGRLLEPKTKSFNDKVYAESLVVFKHFKGKEDAWIGINGKGGPWGYTSSATKLVFENWAPGEPNNGAHDCVHLFNAQWYNYDCNYKAFFICQFVQRPSYDY